MQKRFFWSAFLFFFCIALLTWGIAAFVFAIPHLTIVFLAIIPLLLITLCLYFWNYIALINPSLELVHHIRSFGTGKAFHPQNSLDEFDEIHDKISEIDKMYQDDHPIATGIRQTLPMPYLLVDPQERALHTNQACLDMLEIDGSIEKCLGKTLSDLFYNDPFRSTVVGHSMRENKVYPNLDVTITGHKGRVTNVLANVFPIRDNHGKSVAGLCIYADITSFKQNIAELEQQKKELIAELEKLKKKPDAKNSGFTKKK